MLDRTMVATQFKTMDGASDASWREWYVLAWMQDLAKEARHSIKDCTVRWKLD